MRLYAVAAETAKFEVEKAKYETSNDLNKVFHIPNAQPYPDPYPKP
jgi:hypothetical protein